MNKPLAIVLTVICWIGVGVVTNFSKLVPHASPQEVKPFIGPVIILAVVMTLVMFQSLRGKAKS